MTKTYPRFKTTVDQDRGPHSSGARYTQLTDVITDFGDYSQERWDNLDAAAREWWNDTLADIHEARVALAELPEEVRSEVQGRLEEESCDLEQYAGLIRTVIAEEGN